MKTGRVLREFVKAIFVYAALTALSATGGCTLFTSPKPSVQYTVPLPNGGSYKTTCGHMVDYNAGSASFDGVTVPIGKAGNLIKVGAVKLDEQSLRQASDLIEALDEAQYTYCSTLPLIDASDRYKFSQDFNTQQNTLATLLRNLNQAQSASDAKAAIETAADKATTAASAASTSPSTPSAESNVKPQSHGIANGGTVAERNAEPRVSPTEVVKQPTSGEETSPPFPSPASLPPDAVRAADALLSAALKAR